MNNYVTYLNLKLLISYGVLLNAIVHPSKMQINKFEPFFGGGIGFGHNDPGDIITQSAPHSSAIQGKSTNNLIYQLFIGTEYRFNKNLRLTTDVRWIDFNKILHKSPSSTVLAKMKLKTVALNVGAKYYF